MADNNILICLEQLGIGGVETAVINKAEAFIKKGCKVYILAKPGIYNEILEKKGIICIDFDFKLIENIELDKIKEIASIIKKYDIDQVHIHQFSCLPYAGFAAIMSGIIYNIYIHSSAVEVFDWYINCFQIQKLSMKFFLENAYKLIAITPKAASETYKYFNLSNDNFVIERNSINFDDFVTQNKVTRYK